MPTPTPTGTDLQISTDASFTRIINTDDGTLAKMCPIVQR